MTPCTLANLTMSSSSTTKTHVCAVPCKHCSPGTWLNDEIIHYFSVMIALRDERLYQQDRSRKRSHKLRNEYDVQNPGQYSYQNVKRWSKKVPDIFSLDKIFFLINKNCQHWVCAVIFMQLKFYDSIGSRGKQYLLDLFRCLQDEHQDKKGCPLPDQDEWELVTCRPDTPY